MSATNILFDQAQLAEAAYAKFIDNTGSLITTKTAVATALQDQGFSESQAAEFVKHWKVVSQYNNSQYLGLVGTGFSATVFESLDNPGQFSLSIRGSLDIADFTADTKLIATDGVAVSQLVDLYNYWQSLTHNGAYDAARLNKQEAASVFLDAVYRLNGGNLTAELITYATGLNIPTTYDAARAYFVSQGYVVEGGAANDVVIDGQAANNHFYKRSA